MLTYYYGNRSECNKAKHRRNDPANILVEIYCDCVEVPNPKRTNTAGSSGNNGVSSSNENKANTAYIDQTNTLSNYINRGEVTVIESTVAKNGPSGDISSARVPVPVNRKAKSKAEINPNNKYLEEIRRNFYNSSGDEMDVCLYVRQDFWEQTKIHPNELFTLPEEKQREMVDLYNELGQKYADETNRIINENDRKFEAYLHKPEWSDIQNSIDNPQRFLSILNEAGRRNNNQLPALVASDDNYYHLRLNNSDEMLSIAKQGNHIRLSPLGEVSANFGMDRMRLQLAGYGGGSQMNPSLQNVFVGGGVQYDLKPDSSFSDYSFYNDVSWSVGTRTAVKANLIDITHSSAPKLAVNRDNTFYFQTEKYDIDVKGGASVEIKSPVDVVLYSDGKMEGGINFEDKDGNKKGIGGNSKPGGKISVADKAPDKGGTGIGGSLGGDAEGIEIGVSVPVGAAKAGGGIALRNNSENTEIRGKASVGTNYKGVPVQAKGEVEAGMKVFKPVDLDNILNQLPVDVEDKLYNGFLKNPNLQNFYRDEYLPNNYGGTSVRYPVPEKELKDATGKLHHRIENRRENEIPYEAPKPVWKEYVKPCRM